MNHLLITTERMSQSYSRHDSLCDPVFVLHFARPKAYRTLFYSLQVRIDPAHKTRGKPNWPEQKERQLTYDRSILFRMHYL